MFYYYYFAYLETSAKRFHVLNRNNSDYSFIGHGKIEKLTLKSGGVLKPTRKAEAREGGSNICP